MYHRPPDIQTLGGIYSDHLEYYLPQYEVDECDHIMFRKYLASMNVKTVKYAGDQLFHEIFRDNDPITVYFMFFTY